MEFNSGFKGLNVASTETTEKGHEANIPRLNFFFFRIATENTDFSIHIVKISVQIMNMGKTLVDLQIHEQNSCLFTYNIFIKILYMFRALPCSYSGGLRRNCIYAASGIVNIIKPAGSNN